MNDVWFENLLYGIVPEMIRDLSFSGREVSVSTVRSVGRKFKKTDRIH